MKHCKKCGQTKSLADFYRDNAARDGHRPECKSCTSSRRQAWYAANREREIARVVEWQQRNRGRYNARLREFRRNHPELARADHLRRKFDLTLDEYKCMLHEQDGGCAICGDAPNERISLHIDHDHGTGEIRGLLCFRCNGGLGQFKENSGRLVRAAEYLEGGGRALIDAAELEQRARDRALALRS